MSSRPFVGNSETGVVHNKAGRNDPCRTAEINPENREYFATLEQALKLKRGRRKPYRACKKCVKG